MTRHHAPLESTAVHGTDYNPRLVSWCQKHLTFANFGLNGLAPPLDYDDDSFDFIYARSVFTHLEEPLQRAWMQELRRILRVGGTLYFTTHGRPLCSGLTEEQRTDFESGRLVVTFPESEGGNLCASFQTRHHVEQQLLEGFHLVEFVERRDEEHLRQDVYLVRKS